MITPLLALAALSAVPRPSAALSTGNPLARPVARLRAFLSDFQQVFVKEGTLMKVSRKSRQPRHLFLVNAATNLDT